MAPNVWLLDGVNGGRGFQQQYDKDYVDDRYLELVQNRWTISRAYDGNVVDEFGMGDGTDDNHGRTGSFIECDNMR